LYIRLGIYFVFKKSKITNTLIRRKTECAEGSCLLCDAERDLFTILRFLV